MDQSNPRRLLLVAVVATLWLGAALLAVSAGTFTAVAWSRLGDLGGNRIEAFEGVR